MSTPSNIRDLLNSGNPNVLGDVVKSVGLGELRSRPHVSHATSERNQSVR